MTTPDNDSPQPSPQKPSSALVKCLIVLLVIDLILSSRAINDLPPLTFWLALAICAATPFLIKLMLKQKWAKNSTTTMGLALFLIALIGLLIQNAMPSPTIASTPPETSVTESNASEVKTSSKTETIKPYIKLKDIEITDMGGGVAEVDFKADSSFSSEDELDVAIRKETLTKDGFRRCTFYTRSTYRQLDPMKYGHLKPYTVEELATGTGSTFSEKDPERRICYDFHYAPEKPRKLYPILSVDVSRETENGVTIEDIVEISWSKAHKFY